MHFAGSMVTWPRERGVFFAGFAGYIRVAGRVNRLFNTVFAFWK
jgi:hypothetical protein